MNCSPKLAIRAMGLKLLAWTLLAGATLLPLAIYNRARSDGGGGPRLEPPMTVRREPLRLPIYPVEGLEQNPNELAAIERAVIPRFKESRLPLGLLFHAVRLWGHEARFERGDVLKSGLRTYSSDEMTKVLFDDDQYQRIVTGYNLSHFLVKSPFGVQVLCSSDSIHGREWASAHVGKYLQVMAMLDASSDSVIALDGGHKAMLADAVRDEAMRYHRDVELEWVAEGLARYLECSRWRNRHDQEVTMDDIAGRLIDRGFGEGPCFGCHVPYAIAAMLAVHSQVNILSDERAEQARQRLVAYAELAARTQRADGSWDKRWSAADPRGEHYRNFTWGSEEVDSITVTGHQVEWMLITPPTLRPDRGTIIRAVAHLTAAIPPMRPRIVQDWHVYLPLSHAARAVLLAAGQTWSRETYKP